MKKILFGVAALGLLGLAGAGLGLKAQDSVEVKAAYSTTLKTIYLELAEGKEYWQTEKIDADVADRIVAKYWKAGETVSHCAGTRISNEGLSTTSYLYRFTVPVDVDGLLFCCFQDSGSVYWTGDCQTITLSLPESNNLFTINAWDSGVGNQSGYWHEFHPGDDSLKGNYYLRGGWDKGWTVDGQVKTTEEPAGTFTANVVFGASGKMKMVHVTDKYDTSDAFKDGDGNVVVSSAARYTVVVSGIVGEYGNYVLTSAADPNLTAAITYAEGWMNSFTENCPHTNVGGTVEKVVSTWDAKMTAYAELDPDAQDYLLDGSTTVDEIIAFHSSYDYIYSHYAGVRALNESDADFLSRNPGESPAKSTTALVEENNSSVMIVTTVCVAGAAVLGLLAMRKRRAE